MAILIDKLLDTTTEINGKWYIAKPIKLSGVFNRIREAIGVLNGELSTVYFYEDKVNSYGEIETKYK